jgi:GntR family transcriptional regulator, carbon starvation induced regulator
MSVTGPDSARPQTRAEWAEERLRRAIIVGDFAPEQRILVEQLAAEWRLSATPLREALRTLAGEGLIVLDAQRGARVASVSLDEMLEVYELRLALEPFALRLSIEAAEPGWREQLDAAWTALDAAHRKRPKTPFELEPAHTDFHQALVGGCGSEALLRLTGLLSTQALRFRTLVAPRRPGGNRQSRAEHLRLYELASAGRVDEAAAFLAEHISWPLATVVDPEASARLRRRLLQLRSDLVIEGLAELGVGEVAARV